MSTNSTTEELLEQAARDGSLDLAEWPILLEKILQKLHNIVHNDFPLPQIPDQQPTSLAALQPAPVDAAVIAASPPTTQSSDPPLPPSQSDGVSDKTEVEASSQSSATTNKENAPPPRPPVPSFSATPNPPSSSSIQQSPAPDSPLPPDLLHSYLSSTNILRNTFARNPPYTIQRLAELILNPRRHYRFLPSFLAALDRAVSVTSPVSDFPLPQYHVTGSSGFLTNGDGANGISERGGLGSDEALGGALLTPIPWIKKSEEDALAAAASGDTAGAEQQLRTEEETTIDGPHGAGRIETVSVTTNGFSSSTQPTPAVTGDGEGAESAHLHHQELRSQGAVTQGELLRQEQTAGVVPVGQDVPRHPMLEAGGAAAVGRAAAAALVDGQGSASDVEQGEKVADDRPHARGPDLIGMEDTGPQAATSGEGVVLDMEAAAGRKSPHATSPSLEEGQEDIASIMDKEEGDPLIVEGNQGGVAETAAVAAGEKRKRDGDDSGPGDEKDEDGDKEMTDAAV